MHESNKTNNKQHSKDIAYNLRKARIIAGFQTARAFTRAHNLAESTYYQYENGIRTPSKTTLKKLSALLNTSLADLLPRQGQGPLIKNATIRNSNASSIPRQLNFEPVKMSAQTFAVDAKMFGLNIKDNTKPGTLTAILEEIAEKVAIAFDEANMPLGPRTLVRTTIEIYKDIKLSTTDCRKQLELIPAMTTALKRGLIHSQENIDA